MAQTRWGLIGLIWRAIRQLNPGAVTREATREIQLGIVGTEMEMDEILRWLTQQEDVTRPDPSILRIDISTIGERAKPARNCQLVICASECSSRALGITERRMFPWNQSDPDRAIDDILNDGVVSDLHLALAHRFKVFRKAMSAKIVRSTSMENAAFVASTAVGNIIPNPLSPLIGVAEAAGDLVVLTANQVRMLFRLAGANAEPMGFKELSPQIGTIIAAGFGWRAIARELVGKIPFGGGLVAKATVAYAGTWAVGEAMLYYFSTGRKMSGREMRERFSAALSEARLAAADVVEKLRRRQ